MIELSHKQIAEFLHALESLPPTIWVDELEIGSSGGNSEPMVCQLTVIIFADNSDDSDQVDIAG